MKHLFILILSFFYVQSVYTQNLNHGTGAPSVPSAAGMNYSKYADIPVHHSTGTSSFSIPITSLSEGTISTGLSLTYHSAGIRVAEISSPIGLGWHLNGGGIISRTIQALPDDDLDKGFYHKGGELNTGAGHVAETTGGNRDSESDIYSYNFGGISGKFVFNNIGNIRLIPENDIKIVPYTHPTTGEFLGFMAKASDGTTYYFGQHPSEVTFARETIATVTFDNNDMQVVGEASTTSWHLVKIESYDQNHAIDFSYNNHDYQFFSVGFCSDVAYNDGSGQKFSSNETNEPDCQNEFLYQVEGAVLRTITSSTQTVTFNYFFNREDLLQSTTAGGRRAINQIVVENGDDFCIEYNLTQSYFVDNTPPVQFLNHKRLKLDAISKKACYSATSEPAWTFEYYGNGLFPHYRDKDIDHWGFSNNLTDNLTINTDNLIPNTSLTTDEGTFIYGDATRSSSEAAMLEGMLKKVNYPTKGGYTEFAYEANDYWGSTTESTTDFYIATCEDTDCCGITTDEGSLTITEHIYNTGTWQLCLLSEPEGVCTDPNSNFVRLDVIDNNNNIIITKIINNSPNVNDCISGSLHNLENDNNGNPIGLDIGQTYTFRVSSKNGLGSLLIQYDDITTSANIDCGGLRLQQVTTHDGIDHSKDIIRTYEYTSAGDPNMSSGMLYNDPKYAFYINDFSVLFASSSILPLSGFSGYHIGYRRVVVHHNGNGSQEFNFEVEDDVQVYDNYPIVPPNLRVEDGAVKSQYTYEGNSLTGNITEIASQSVTRYAEDEYDMINSGYKAEKLRIYGTTTGLFNVDRYTVFRPQTSVYRPGMVISTQDGVSTTVEYSYDDIEPMVLSPSSIVSTNSDGESFRKDIYYTVDYPEFNIATDLRTANHVGIPYRTEIYHDGNWLDGQRTTYSFFDNANGLPTSSTTENQFPKPHTIERYTRTWEGGILQSGEWTLQSTIAQYDAANGLVKSILQDGWTQTENILYNDNKLPIRKKYLNHEVYTAYYPNSSMVQTTTAIDGTTMDYHYDALMRLESISNCKGAVTSYDYHFADIDGGNLDYIQTTKDYSNATDNNNPNSDINILNSRVYKDGLGRAIETVLIQQGPAPHQNDDIIMAVEYDNQGRAFKQYEAQAASNNFGNYVPPSGFSTITEFYPSPLNRPQQTTAPDWDYPTQYEYSSNSVGDAVFIDGSTFSVYPSGTLYKQTTIDGNDNKSISFTDIKGRTVLARQTNAGENSTFHHDTYIIYDDKDRKSHVLPPGTMLADSDLIYEYEYDGEDKMTKKKVPGRAETQFEFNQRDLLAAYQDGYWASEGSDFWYAYNYDEYGREVKQGIYQGNIPNTITELSLSDVLIETSFGTESYDKDKVVQSRSRILQANGLFGGWLESNNTYDPLGCHLLTSQSSNNHLNLGGTNDNSTYTYDVTNSITNTTYHHSTPNFTTDIHTTATFDHIGRSILDKFQVGMGTNTTLCKKEYDHENQLITAYQGGTGLSGTNDFLQKMDYSYLENGLLVGMNINGLTGSQQELNICPLPNVEPSPNSPINDYDAKDLFSLSLAYDDPLAGTNATAQFNGNIANVNWQVRGREQELYSLNYDIYDRMTLAQSYAIDASNILSYTGHYDVNVSYDKRGNIKTLNRNGLYAYGGCWEDGEIDNLTYEYYNDDEGNQLKRVIDTAPEGCVSDLILTNQVSSSITYEAGNTITASNLISGNASELSAIDVQYLAGNCINLEAGFEVALGEMFLADIQPCGGTEGNKNEGFQQNSLLIYTYDANGNLERDPNKRITTTFNHLDLPRLIEFDDGRRLEFTYDATGSLLTKKAINADNSLSETRDYINGLEYLNGQIESIYHAQGRLHYVDGTPRMEYFFKDHLGNTRLVYSDLNGDGVIDTPSEILQESHFYPYGMPKKGPWMENLNNPMAYQFNGIEKVDNFGLGVNMALYRTLDPELGVWWGVDPYAEAFAPMSPYCAMNASPLMYSDPQGDIPVPVITGLIGAVGNLAYQGFSGNLNSGWDVVKAAGVGFAAGAAGGYVGQAFASAAAATTFSQAVLSGAATGAATGYTEGFIRGLGNDIFFGNGDPIREAVQGATFGFITGGLVGGIGYKVNSAGPGNVPPDKNVIAEFQTGKKGGKPVIEVDDLELNQMQPAGKGQLNVPDAVNSGLYSGKVTNYNMVVTPQQAKIIEKGIAGGHIPDVLRYALKHNTNPVAKKTLLELSSRHSLNEKDFFLRGVISEKLYISNRDNIIKQLITIVN